MRDYLPLGSVPIEEDCVQVGDPEYYQKYRDECNRYRELLLKKFGPLPVGMALVIKGFPHDFGEYHEVCVMFDDEIEEQVEFAFGMENNMPLRWEE